MKKLLAIVLLITLLATLFVGCGKKTECDICGDEEWCTKDEIADEEIWVCKDCKEDLEELREAAEELEDMFK